MESPSQRRFHAQILEPEAARYGKAHLTARPNLGALCLKILVVAGSAAIGKGIIPLLDEKTRHDSAPDGAAGSHVRIMGAADLISIPAPDPADSDATESGTAKLDTARLDAAKSV